MKILITIIALFLTTFPLFAQRTCGTTQRHLTRIQNDPSVLQRQNNLNQRIANYLTANPQLTENQLVVTIPVVVHVVYPSATTAANITDAQINSQITALNRDYAKTNTDVSNVPAVWQGLAANTQIQFCLARRTPAGGATTGITRRSTTRTSFTDAASRLPLGMDEIKFSTYGTPSWDRTKYLNIWVGRLDGTTLGYAYFLSDLNLTDPTDAGIDGVVIDYRCFGTTGTAGTGGFTPFTNGRTATHEVGHYLNLSHIWGDDLTASTTDCESDNVADTPPQLDDNAACPTFPLNVGGSCVTHASGEMFMNYMDYTDDGCMYMFTTGQSQRMNTSITLERAGLMTSNGCDVPINVEMVYFKGENVGKANRLIWKTASESSNDFFEIEKSNDGKNFHAIAKLKGNGTTTTAHFYELTDPSVSNDNWAYYRLRQVDFDGTFAYSNVISLKNGGVSKVKIFPNPVSNHLLTVQFDNNSSKEVSLLDALGRIVFSQKTTDFDVKIATENLAAGIYFCRIQTVSGSVEVQKVVVR